MPVKKLLAFCVKRVAQGFAVRARGMFPICFKQCWRDIHQRTSFCERRSAPCTFGKTGSPLTRRNRAVHCNAMNCPVFIHADGLILYRSAAGAHAGAGASVRMKSRAPADWRSKRNTRPCPPAFLRTGAKTHSQTGEREEYRGLAPCLPGWRLACRMPGRA